MDESKVQERKKLGAERAMNHERTNQPQRAIERLFVQYEVRRPPALLYCSVEPDRPWHTHNIPVLVWFLCGLSYIRIHLLCFDVE